MTREEIANGHLLTVGWSWVALDKDIPDIESYGREKPLREGFTRMQRARLGCILSIGPDGDVTVDYGRSRPQTATEQPQEAPDATDGPTPTAADERLSGVLCTAVAAMLKDDARLSVAVMIAALASGGHVLNIRAGDGSRGTAEDFAKVFEGIAKASVPDLMAMLGQIVQHAVSVTPDDMEDMALPAVIAAIAPDLANQAIADAFDARSYLSDLTIEEIALAVQDATHLDDRADAVREMTKDDAVAYGLAQTKRAGWLPLGLRSPYYTGPDGLKSGGKN